MARFASVVARMQLQLQDVINVFWYRQDELGEPSEGDLAQITTQWLAEVWQPYKGILTNYVGLMQLVVQGYGQQFQRAPYLPYITDYTETGLVAQTPGPPIQCAIMSARVEPVEAGYRGNYPGPYERTPVRRGYWAISGLPDAHHLVSGRMDAAFLNSAPAIAVQVAFAKPLASGTALDMWEPIRVSQPPKNTELRGYGLVKTAKFSPLVSARRSRKIGQGAR